VLETTETTVLVDVESSKAQVPLERLVTDLLRLVSASCRFEISLQLHCTTCHGLVTDTTEHIDVAR